MKKNKGCCISTSILLAGIVIVTLLAAAYIFYIGPNLLEDKRAQSRPPSILVQSPQAGDTVPAESPISARAVVTAMNPIARVELRVDGNLVATLTPETQGQTTYNAFSELQVGEGVHMLSWRAVDTVGLVGQSMPIQFAGEVPPAVADVPAAGSGGNQNPPGGNAGQDGGNQGGAGGGQWGDPDPTPPLPDPPSKAYVIKDAIVAGPDLGDLIPKLLASMPAAPTKLQVGFKDCRVQLTWYDNASNETHFNVRMQALGGPPATIKKLPARPETGQTWYEFDAPPLGRYSIWVEAANGFGSQPSEIQGVTINKNCSELIATHLEIEALSMYGIDPAWENIYCYVSLEGVPEERIPEGSVYFDLDPVQGADIHTWMGGQNRRLVPIPSDEMLTIQGKCMGWLGGLAQPMGFINENIPMAYWDNRTLQILRPNFSIDYRIRPHVFSTGEGVYEYIDESIPSPFLLKLETKEGSTPEENAFFAQYPTLIFAWKGDREIVTGFTVYVNGAPNLQETTFAPFAQWHEVPFGPLPTSCGGTYQFQVAINSGQARSELSNTVVYEQPPCQRYAELTYERYYFVYYEGEDCSAAEAGVGILQPEGWQYFSRIPMACGQEFDFSVHPGSHQFIEIAPNGGTVIADLEFKEYDYIAGALWSYPTVCVLYKEYPIPPPDENWGNFEITDELRCSHSLNHDASGTVYLSIRGTFGSE
jgi:hypothetical protein